MKTKVINIYAGSGAGKSTLAAGLFFKMKKAGLNVELAREWVKSWAWSGRKITELDQLHISGQQSEVESSLYGKVDYVITDSPLLLSAIYDEFYNTSPIVLSVVQGFLARAKALGVHHVDFRLMRHKKFNPQGRYETEATARAIDTFIDEKLPQWGITPIVVDKVSADEQVDFIFAAVVGESI